MGNLAQPVTKVLESISSPRAVIRKVGDSATAVVQIAEDSVSKIRAELLIIEVFQSLL